MYIYVYFNICTYACMHARGVGPDRDCCLLTDPSTTTYIHANICMHACMRVCTHACVYDRACVGCYMHGCIHRSMCMKALAHVRHTSDTPHQR